MAEEETVVAVAKVVKCPCGAVLEGPDEEVLVQRVRAHALETHAIMLAEAQALAMARPI